MTNNNNELYETTGIDRRGFMKGIGATAGVATTGVGGSYYATHNARAIPPLAIAGGVAAAAIGAGYVMREVAEHVTGRQESDESFSELEIQETHALVEEIFLDMRATDDSVLTNMENVLATAENAAYTDAQAAAIEQMDAGNSEQEAIDAATQAVTDFYVTTETNLLDHSLLQAAKIDRNIYRLAELVYPDNASGNMVDYLTIHNINDIIGEVDPIYKHPGMTGYVYSVEYEKLDGSMITVSADDMAWFSNSGTTLNAALLPFMQYASATDSNPTNPEESAMLYWANADGSGENLVYDQNEYEAIFDELFAQHDQVTTDITSWVETVYPKYEQGDVNLDNLVTSSQFSSSAAEKTGYSFATADLAVAGIPIAEGLLTIELPQANDGSGATVSGTLSARNPPEGGFDVGTEYTPEEITGPIWMAYNYENDQGEDASELIELEQPFVITEAETTEGESLDTVTMRSRNQRTLETDVQALNDELGQLADYQEEMQEKQEAIAEDSNNGGGGGGLPNTDDLFLFERFFGIPFWAWLSAGLTGIYGITQDE